LLTHRFKIAFPRTLARESNGETTAYLDVSGNRDDVGVEVARTIQEHTCSLALYGDLPIDGSSSIHFSAMAKTVGYPVALATDLLLHAPKPSSDSTTSKTNTVSDAWIPIGILLPTHKAIYEPILKACPALGIHFHESVLKTPTLFH